MRKIEFRAKRTTNNEWVCGDLMHASSVSIGYNLDIFIRGHRGYNYTVKEETISQFTGLYDKNGKKIYEGDIVAIESRYDATNGVVAWNENLGSWCIHLKGESKIGNVPLGEMILCYDMHIIGNIHDNPELIKEEKQ